MERMAHITKFTVVPKLPEKIERLRDVAQNLYWSWFPEAVGLFFRIDPDLWNSLNHNPIRMLGIVSQERLEELAVDDTFLAHLQRVWARMQEYMGSSTWHERYPDTPKEFSVAYFSAEFGVHECVSIYSGGLGVLAGDHLKAASDLALPLVGIGLLYREGYHSQYLNADGWQQERYPQNDFYTMPLTLVRDDNGDDLLIEVEYPERPVKARIWKCQVGQAPLYLLDTDVEDNDPDNRAITARLYGGDSDMRIRQEILLGMGGVRALRALDIHPTVYHMNEGHSAFMALQRIKELIHREGITVEHAIEAVKATILFTTHTPVAAGNDMFPRETVEYYFRNYVEDIGIPMERLLAWGRQDRADQREPFAMPVLALRLSAAANGVSALHGQVSRGMWARTWQGVPENEVPITSVTNGVHIPSWVSWDMGRLYDRYLGPDWVNQPHEPEVWARIEEVPDAELWRTHERRRERLVNFARRRLVAQCLERGEPKAAIKAVSEALDPDVLTIAFARRFATYKRANMLLIDPERLVRILTDAERPVQMIIAGKAHPADTQGKELIRNIIHFLRKYDVRDRVVFIPDYDINVARYMVQGADCWLNTPRRPMEASGTSGMKAAANGVLNVSIPDGWWCEAERLGENGWSIGRGEMYENHDEQDVVESEMLYELLESEIVPTFYDRPRGDVPRHWVERMKAAIGTIGPVFNTHRMVREYCTRFYIPSTIRRAELRVDKRRRSGDLAAWKQKVRECWGQVHFVKVQSGSRDGLPYGSKLSVQADVALAALDEEDVTVEIYFGDIDRYGRIPEGTPVEMDFVGRTEDKAWRFEGAIHCRKTGQQGFCVRVIPNHEDLAQKHETGLISWA
jgi:starch phosphorylase